MVKSQGIASLNELGQSIWYDNLSRDVLQSGKLRAYIESGVSGLTSNPTIFKKAIADSDLYDSDIRELSARGLGAEAVAEELMIKDVGTAADLLRPVFESTAGADGYASIEVSPLLADDAAATTKAAQSLWRKLGRPNVMIKVPATAEGLPAITELLEAGINVNITLIFSGETYENVAEAYLAALEARMQRGETVRHISSVASFFVSRVDSICEKKLETLVSEGKISASQQSGYSGVMGIANSRLAYRTFKRLFSSHRFQALEREGRARVQRPLWASTGTKNPAFDPLLYVSALAGKDTVNTLPPQTLDALLRHGSLRARIEDGTEEGARFIESFDEAGGSFAVLLQKLKTEGVKLFADSYTELLQSVDEKIRKLAGK